MRLGSKVVNHCSLVIVSINLIVTDRIVSVITELMEMLNEEYHSFQRNKTTVRRFIFVLLSILNFQIF